MSGENTESASQLAVLDQVSDSLGWRGRVGVGLSPINRLKPGLFLLGDLLNRALMLYFDLVLDLGRLSDARPTKQDRPEHETKKPNNKALKK